MWGRGVSTNAGATTYAIHQPNHRHYANHTICIALLGIVCHRTTHASLHSTPVPHSRPTLQARVAAEAEYAEQLAAFQAETRAAQELKLLSRMAGAALGDSLGAARKRIWKRAQVLAEIITTEQR
jgi:hypothetical protein